MLEIRDQIFLFLMKWLNIGSIGIDWLEWSAHNCTWRLMRMVLVAGDDRFSRFDLCLGSVHT